MGKGRLKIQVVAAGGAILINDALVVISDANNIIYELCLCPFKFK